MQLHWHRIIIYNNRWAVSQNYAVKRQMTNWGGTTVQYSSPPTIHEWVSMPWHHIWHIKGISFTAVYCTDTDNQTCINKGKHTHARTHTHTHRSGVPAWWVTPEKLHYYRPLHTRRLWYGKMLEMISHWSVTDDESWSVSWFVFLISTCVLPECITSRVWALHSHCFPLPSAATAIAITGRTKPFFDDSLHFGIAGRLCKTTQSHCICITAHVPLACH